MLELVLELRREVDGGDIRQLRTDEGKTLAQKRRLEVASTLRKRATNGGGSAYSGEQF